MESLRWGRQLRKGHRAPSRTSCAAQWTTALGRSYMTDRPLVSAEIVAVGTEILLGSLVDTNTAWLSQRLGASGVVVYRHTTVGDDKGCLVAILSEAASRADLVISTGGLGPTPDDLTNEALGQATGREMVEYPKAKRHINEVF